MSSLNIGIYFIKIQQSNNNLTSVLKIIKNFDKNNDQYLISTETEEYSSESLIVATGLSWLSTIMIG